MRTTVKFWTLVILVFGLSMPASAQEGGEKYGKGLSLTDTTLISEILSKPDQFVGKTLMVKGRIVDVCEKRGCWIALAGDKPHQTLRIKVRDGEIVFPLEAKGKMAVAEGVFQKFELSKEQVIKQKKHHAEEHGESFDPATVTGPETYYQIKGSGARIMQ